MESIDLEMGDIFDDEAVTVGDGELPPPLPEMDTEDAAPGDGDRAEGDATDPQTRDMSKGAAKKRVMKPQPRLDAQRLKSERGLPALPGLFENVPFKGKGHEASDLKLMMGRLEHWAHRLFPKIPFDDFIGRLEKLGQTKPVQTCLKRIRLDMSVGDDNVVLHDEDNEDGVVADRDDAAGATHETEPVDADEAFERMIARERRHLAGDTDDAAPSSSQTPVAPPPPVTPLTPADPATPVVASASSSQGLTPDQLERMKRNREQALQRRGRQTPGTPGQTPRTPQTPGTPPGQTPRTPQTPGTPPGQTPQRTPATQTGQTPPGQTGNTPGTPPGQTPRRTPATQTSQTPPGQTAREESPPVEPSGVTEVASEAEVTVATSEAGVKEATEVTSDPHQTETEILAELASDDDELPPGGAAAVRGNNTSHNAPADAMEVNA